MKPSSACRRLVVVGAGGHGKVVAAAAADAGYEVVGFLDDNKPLGTRVLGFRVVGRPLDAARTGAECFIVAIGDNIVRAKLFYRLLEVGLVAATVVHPKAYVSRYAVLGCGVFVAPGAVVQPGAVVADNAFINTSASVDHDARVWHHVAVNPQAVLTGNTAVGYFSYIHSNAVLAPGIVVGDNSVVGAGAVVTRDVDSDTVVVGIPAQRLRPNPAAPPRSLIDEMTRRRHCVAPDKPYQGRVAETPEPKPGSPR